MTLVSLTEEGCRRVVAAGEACRASMRESFLDHCTPEDLAEFTRLSLRLLETLDPEHWLLVGSDPFEAYEARRPDPGAS